MHIDLPTQILFKTHAKLIRAVIGNQIKHSEALNLLSMAYGYNNWHICKVKLPQEDSYDENQLVLIEGEILKHSMMILKEYKRKDDKDKKDEMIAQKFTEEYINLWDKYVELFFFEYQGEHNRIVVNSTDENLYELNLKKLKKLGNIYIKILKELPIQTPQELAKYEISRLDNDLKPIIPEGFFRKGKINYQDMVKMMKRKNHDDI